MDCPRCPDIEKPGTTKDTIDKEHHMNLPYHDACKNLILPEKPDPEKDHLDVGVIGGPTYHREHFAS